MERRAALQRCGIGTSPSFGADPATPFLVVLADDYKDYILERKTLTDQLEKVDARLNEISKALTSRFDMSDDELLKTASYFFINQELADKRFVDYRRLLKASDPRVVKNFITSVTSNFCIENGKIRSITFRNGIIHEFVYTGE